MNGISIENGRDASPHGRLFVMGRVRGAFGIKGWISVEPFTESPERLAQFGAWWIGTEGSWRSVPVAEAAVHGARVVARLEGCTQREAAASLRGAEVAILREALPAPGEGEYYQADLIGLAVLNRAGERLGRIERIFENGAHAVLQLRGDGEGHANERLIPFVGHVVEHVDLAAGEVRVDWGADW